MMPIARTFSKAWVKNGSGCYITSVCKTPKKNICQKHDLYITDKAAILIINVNKDKLNLLQKTLVFNT